MRLGPFTVHEVLAGRFALDGGTLFGHVPRALWAAELPPDDENRVGLVARALLVLHGDRRILVGTGPGSVWDPVLRDRFRIQGPDARAALGDLGVAPEDVTDVVLTHLHWPQAGGLVQGDPGAPALSFPRAVHHVQRRAWKWAHAPTDRDRACFPPQVLEVLDASGRVHFVEGESEVVEGLSLLPVEGHTVGQQLVRLEAGDETLLFCGGAIPTAAHVHVAWGMGYDLYPLTVVEEKKQILAQALEDHWTVVFAHEPRFAACSVREEGGCTVVDEVRTL